MSSNLILFVALYLLVSVCIGLYAASKVKSSADYVVAGRHLPLAFIIATVFATWFGSETVLGIPAKFLNEGLRGVVADPFGSSMCLILVGLFFARPLYRMKLLTIGDYYRARYNRGVEVTAAVCIVISYLGWVSAQITALGLVFSILSNGAIAPWQGMILGVAIVLIWTLSGGMLSVAFTDLFQMSVIMAGMLYIGYVISGMVGGPSVVIEHASAAGKLEFWPDLKPRDVVAFVAAWATMALGSIPQQDVFQRVASAKNERVAASGSVMGGCLYFVFAFVPMYLAYSATLMDPALIERYLQSDSQQILPRLILTHAPFAAQVFFFGALISAILSCSAATLLAPSVTVAENLLRPFMPNLTDKQFLLMLRIVVFLFACAVLTFALVSSQSIYGMVENAYKITLSAAVTPLAFGLYWKKATTQGAALAMIAGLSTWIALEIVNPEAFVPPQFAGFLASVAAMVAGSLLPQWHGVAARATAAR
jgi:solute:Na+ symporter, SSS family